MTYGNGELSNGGWIPLKIRPMTEEEMIFHSEWIEYGAEIFDCPLPEDGQEVLVSCGGYVCVDTFCKDDGCYGCYFEGVDIEDVDAWMPLPQPYEPQESKTKQGLSYADQDTLTPATYAESEGKK